MDPKAILGCPGFPVPWVSVVARDVWAPKGNQGHVGPIGPPGPRGPQGETGNTGMSGLDGRDGLPGEPGLDGVPGRSGFDGTPGVDGIPGLPGSPGVPGSTGRTGSRGRLEKEGQGTMGERGMPGLKGKAGENGKDGQQGEPGISLWATHSSSKQGSSSTPTDQPDFILIPPSISGGGFEGSAKRVLVEEGAHLKLTCIATGNPQAGHQLEQESHTQGPSLSLPRVNREHTGMFKCEANNGIPPTAYQIYDVEVQFSPLITIHQPLVGGSIGQSVTLECLIDSFPWTGVVWERYDGQLLPEVPSDEDEKYRKSEKKSGVYGRRVSLTVEITSSNDFGMYYCRSENLQGSAVGSINVFESTPGSVMPPPLLSGGSKPVVVGQRPPPFSSVEDLCPPPISCQDCHNYWCKSNLRRDDLTIVPYETSLKKLPNRTEACVIAAIGKPVLLRFNISGLFGSWMKETSMISSSNNGGESYVFWETMAEENQTLLQYPSKSEFGAKRSEVNYTLPLPFNGNDHVVFNGTFFYYNHDHESVVSFNLVTGFSSKLVIPRNAENEGKERLLTKLYQDQNEDNYFDFSVDENGLWGLFALAHNNHTVVMKLDHRTLEPQYMWDVAMNHREIIDTFVVCGMLYVVERTVDGHIRIGFAIDLYKNKIVDLDLPFTNPYGQITMLNYNPNLQSLTSWDGGKPLTYPIKYKKLTSKYQSYSTTVDYEE